MWGNENLEFVKSLVWFHCISLHFIAWVSEYDRDRGSLVLSVKLAVMSLANAQ